MQALARQAVTGPVGCPPAVLVCSRQAATARRTYRGKQHKRAPPVQARQRWDYSSSSDSRSSSGSRSFAKTRRFKFGEAEFTVPEDSMWRFGLPAAALIGSAALIGPLVIGLAVGAVAIGGALSAGAMAFTLLPLIMFGALSIAGMAMFGAFATLGFALVIPKLILSGLSLAFVAGGLLLGSSAVGLLAGMQGNSSSSPASGDQSYGAWTDGAAAADEAQERAAEAVRQAQEEAEARRAAAELRSFDELLARSEEKRRVEEWRRSRQ